MITRKSKKKHKQTPSPFEPPYGADAVMDGEILVGYVAWEGGDQWRAYTASGKDLGVFSNHHDAIKTFLGAEQMRKVSSQSG
jgi:hypothetical protein